MSDIIDPPIVTDPFDPFGSVALRYKCFALNQRNTFLLQPSSSYCRSRTSAVDLNQMSKNTGNCYKRSLASSAITARSVFCGYKSSGSVITNMDFKICRLNKTTPLTLVTSKKSRCLTSPVSVNMIQSERLRHSCISSPRLNFTAKWACHSYAALRTTVTPLTFSLNTERCRITPQIDYSTYVLSKACHSYLITKPTILTTIGIAPRVGGISCKIYEPFILNPISHRACRSVTKVSSAALSYTVAVGMFACKLNVRTDIATKHWRCGTYVLTIVDARIFGRVWGGRYLAQLPNGSTYTTNVFVRESGRMFGKFR